MVQIAISKCLSVRILRDIPKGSSIKWYKSFLQRTLGWESNCFLLNLLRISIGILWEKYASEKGSQI